MHSLRLDDGEDHGFPDPSCRRERASAVVYARNGCGIRAYQHSIRADAWRADELFPRPVSAAHPDQPYTLLDATCDPLTRCQHDGSRLLQLSVVFIHAAWHGRIQAFGQDVMRQLLAASS